MTATLPPMIRFQPLVAGAPLPGGLVYFYAAGTTTPQAAYAADGTTPLANPLTLDANGATDFRLGTGLAYKIDLKMPDGLTSVTGWPKDNIVGSDALTAYLADTTTPGNGDALIGVKQPISGAIARTQHDKNSDVYNAKDFGTITGNQANDQATILAAVSGISAAGGGVLIIPYGASQSVELATLALTGNVLIRDERWAKHDLHDAQFGSGRDVEKRVEGRATSTGEGPSLVIQNTDDNSAALTATVTITIASPAVLSTVSAHGFKSGDLVRLTTTGALPTGLATGTDYYIINPTTNTFQLAASQDAAAINTSGSQSGTHTATQQKNRSGALIWRSGPKANQLVQGVLRCGVFDSSGNWINDIDINPDYYSTIDQSVAGDPALTRSRLRTGRRGTVLINPGVSASLQDTDAANLIGLVFGVNTPFPMNFACTISIASPGVITLTSASAVPNGTAVQFTTTGALPTGLATNTTYYVVGSNYKPHNGTLGTTFNVATTVNGTAINTSGTQSGSHTLVVSPQNLVTVDLAGLHTPQGVVCLGGPLVHAAERVPNVTQTDMTGTPSALTITANQRYVYAINNSASAVTVTFPNASSFYDGTIITVVFQNAVTTMTWASSGGSFVGAPSSAAANTPYSFIYSDGSGGKWLPYK